MKLLDYHFESQTNKCYKFHATPRKFARALFVCSAEGGHLVIINSDEESKVITQIFARYPAATMIGNFPKDFAFVGFHNWGESADWTTIHGIYIQTYIIFNSTVVYLITKGTNIIGSLSFICL